MAETPIDPAFVHLHVHSHYSLLNAIPTPKELVKAASEDGQKALALTDSGALYGAIDFLKACGKSEVKPIIGIDAYLAPRTRRDMEANIDKPRSRLVLLAKNNQGYKNLIKMVTLSNTEGFYYKPRIDRELITQFKEGLVCIIPSFAGETSQHLKNNDQERAQADLAWYQSIFEDDCYLELTHHPEMLGHQELQEKIKTLSKAGNVPLVAAHDVYYLHKEDATAREVMMKIQSGGSVDLSQERTEDFSFITQGQAKEYFSDVPQALSNTIKIADACSIDIPIGTKWYFPNYIIESGKDADEELRDEAYKGVAWRGHSLDNPINKERLDYELSVIQTKGYAKYFLVVGDLLREARERKILTTIRGSVAGSYTTYVLGITNVDPLEYKLPFERFLNPERPSAPDIDMDYADNRRDEIIEYAKQKYGADKVAQIGTFGTMMARAAVRDVARALGHPYSVGDTIAKLIPMGSQGFAMTIDRALDIEPELRKLYKQDSDSRDVIDLAKKIEGRARHVGVHAAGVVIAPEPLSEFVPIQLDTKTGKFITQYEMKSVGEDGVGLLKFDFLGIKNLAILADAVKRVKAIRDEDIDLEEIDLADSKTFAMLAAGQTMGLFQLNGSGMTAFLKQLQPSSIHDINAMVALYRPGPMESIPQYIERKHDKNLITYLDPRMKEYLEFSYGLLVYQDDVLLTAINLGGYSWLEADMLRKAMGKKIPEVMAAEKEKLMGRLIEKGLPAKKAELLWKSIEPFAAYGFGKAHAASYGRVAYQTAYMKANYPVEYMSAVLTADSGDTEKIAEIIHECERMGIDVLPPDINESFSAFSVVPNTQHIRFGLTTIKNFGEGIADAIIEERKKGGHFKSLGDFLTRVHDKNLNKKSLEALIATGALDRFEKRGKMYINIENMLGFNKEHVAGKEANQDSLFGGMSTAVNELTLQEWDSLLEEDRIELQKKMTWDNENQDAKKEQKLMWEKELLGIYVSGHPLDEFKDELESRTTISQVKNDGRNGIPVVTAGMIETVKELLTKKGDRMAFITLSNLEDSIEMVAFPEVYQNNRHLFTAGTCVAIKGKLSIRNEQPSILIDKCKALGAKEEPVPQ